jgi:hypothetical protein
MIAESKQNEEAKRNQSRIKRESRQNQAKSKQIKCGIKAE